MGLFSPYRPIACLFAPDVMRSCVSVPGAAPPHTPLVRLLVQHAARVDLAAGDDQTPVRALEAIISGKDGALAYSKHQVAEARVCLEILRAAPDAPDCCTAVDAEVPPPATTPTATATPAAPAPAGSASAYAGPYAKQMEELLSMGLDDLAANARELERHKGDMAATVTALLPSSP